MFLGVRRDVMKYNFFLNWMGPVALSWYEDNNIPFIEEVRWSTLFEKWVAHKTLLTSVLLR